MLDTGVEIEVIVADFHDVFINACLKCFSELQLPVTMKQGPMQSVLLDVVQEHRNGTPTDEESATQTFILFGGYGNGMINSGLQKQLHDVFLVVHTLGNNIHPNTSIFNILFRKD